jgi:hypothetical protein
LCTFQMWGWNVWGMRRRRRRGTIWGKNLYRTVWTIRNLYNSLWTRYTCWCSFDVNPTPYPL